MTSPPPACPPPAQPGFWGTFADPGLEGRYRGAHAAADVAAFRLVVWVAAAGAVLFVLNDLPQPAELPLLLGLRATFVAGSAAALWRLGRPLAPAGMDRLAVGWLLLLAAMNLLVQVLRPPAHLGHAVTTVCIIIVTYGATAVSPRVQALVGWAHAAGCLLVAGVVNPTPDLGFLRALAVGLLCGNVLGVLTAGLLHARGRRLFLALETQAELTATLGKALAEVRTLRGLIRICAWCKGIHADGEWQQLEAYVAAHSHAEFSHGICPGCLAGLATPARASNGCDR